MSTLIENKKKFSNLISIIDQFFTEKDFLKKNYINTLNEKIYKKCDIKFSKKQLSNILIAFHNSKDNFNKFKKIHKTINIEINNINPQSGGFLYLPDENKYAQALNLVDFIIDIINLIPNNVFTKNYYYIAAPYGTISLLINLMRGNYDFAFYSLLGLIPGVGGAIAASAKIIHKIISYIISKNKIDESEEYYKQLQSSRRVHDYLKSETFERSNNPFLGNFEEEYNYDKYFDELDIV